MSDLQYMVVFYGEVLDGFDREEAGLWWAGFVMRVPGQVG
jgi:hypothetical protein